MLALGIASAAWGLFYAADHLEVNTSTTRMFSLDLPWRQQHLAYEEAFPQLGGSILVVLDGATPELAQVAAKRLARALALDEALFDVVHAAGSDDFLTRHALLYAGIDDLEALSDALAAAQPFLGRLASDPSLRGLFALLADLGRADSHLRLSDLSFFYGQMADALDAAVDARFAPVSWQALSQGEPADPKMHRRFVVARPHFDFERLLPARLAIERVRAVALELGLEPSQGVRVRLSGSAALEYEELVSATQGAKVAGAGALIGVTIILLWALRSIRLVIAALVALMVGLSWTVWFAAWVVGHLNIISVAFAVLYIGLGIDYAIHYCLRVRELLRQGNDVHSALASAAGDVGGSLVICSLTTGVGFFAFVPSDFSGVSELGLISGTGMFVSLFASMTVLPATIAVMFASAGTGARAPILQGGLAGIAPLPAMQPAPSWERRFRGPILILAGLTAVASGILAARIQFDYNPLRLRDPNSESVSTYLSLLASEGSAPWTAAALAPSYEGAQSLAGRLQRLGSVAAAQTLSDLIPDAQTEKLALVEELELLLGGVLDVQPRPAPNPGEIWATLAELLAVGARTGATPSERRFFASLAQFQAIAAGDGAHRALSMMHRNGLVTLPLQLENLAQALEAEPITVESIPADILARWRSSDGRYRVRIEPSADLNDNQALRHFVTEVRTVVPDATDTPIVNFEAGAAVIRAFTVAFVYAFGFIAVVLLLTFKSWKDAGLVLLLVGLGSLYASAALYVVGLTFNFANVIALPLLLGIGVDNGIHMLHRMRTAPPHRGGFLSTSTARAVVASALTTICGFGNLAFSPHQGMASMGILLTLGLAFSLVCTLLVLPVIIEWRVERAERGEQPVAG